MSQSLVVSIGQYSDKGRKSLNQDFYGASTPSEPLLSTKGIAIALADGISSSDVSRAASEAAVTGFLSDYFCTSETWSVKTSVQRVLMAINSWLHSQTQKSDLRFDKNRGYVCTLSALVLKSNTAYLFHLGDTRIYRLRAQQLQLLTHDHRVQISDDKSYLSRAMGFHPDPDIEHQSVALELGDLFLLATDGVYEFIDAEDIQRLTRVYSSDLNKAAQAIVDEAYSNGSNDNLTVQLVRIDALPYQAMDERIQQLTELPFAPILEARMEFDGYDIIRTLHASSRSHVYLAQDKHSDRPNQRVVLKTPSIDLRGDAAYLERFMTEEWIAKRIRSPYVLKPCVSNRKRGYLYTAFEYIEGQTLTQWMLDHPKPTLESVREIIEQIAKGLRAFHRLEMLHQDLRPENILIDTHGVVKIIDFGSVKVAGLDELSYRIAQENMLGTAQYTAPEYFLGEVGSPQSDQFSLAVITYQMLTGQLPYGSQVAKARSRAAQHRLVYRSALHNDREIPAWIDETLKKALQPQPHKRYEALSEFLLELRIPSRAFLTKTRPPLIERDPVMFWQGVSALFFAIIIVLLTTSLD